MRYISPIVRIKHFKQLNRRTWNALVVVCIVMEIMILLLSGSSHVANSEMKMSFAESVFALNQKFLNDNPKIKEWIK